MKPRKKEKKEKEKNREPKKSAGRHGGLTHSEQEKHLERKRKKTTFQVRNDGVSVLVVLVLLLHHPILVLIFKQQLCCNLTRCLG
jgi:hypothetical protein